MKRSKMVKVTTKKQFEKLLELMEKNPFLASGSLKNGANRQDVKMYWCHFTSELNALGPPVRDIEGWRKVWADYKTKLRRKVAKEQKLGSSDNLNESVAFTQLEETTIKLLNMENILYQVKTEDSPFEISSSSNYSNSSLLKNEIVEVKIDAVSDHSENGSTASDTLVEIQSNPDEDQDRGGGNGHDNIDDNTDHNLNKNKFYADLKEHLRKIEYNTSESLRYRKKLFKLKEEKLALYKEDLQFRRQIEIDKQRLKIQVLGRVFDL